MYNVVDSPWTSETAHEFSNSLITVHAIKNFPIYETSHVTKCELPAFKLLKIYPYDLTMFFNIYFSTGYLNGIYLEQTSWKSMRSQLVINKLGFDF